MAQASVAKPSAGILPMPVTATQKMSTTLAKSAPKPPAPRLKLVVRRLPPGLTHAEFEICLGDEWKIGNGKVDLFQYKTGKVSKDPAKPARPARAYLHLTSEDLIAHLSDKVRGTSFQDARNSGNDPVLLGPPSLEFAPYARIPGSRVRKDGRQGTIDQDPEFIAFLESLTNPVTRPTPTEPGAENEKKEDDAITVTPLVQYIKDKKANKAKEGASPSKSLRHGKADKESKAEKVQAKKLLKRPGKEKEKEKHQQTTESDKVEKATKEAVKAATKQAANAITKASKQATPAKELASPASAATPTPVPERKRERGDISVAAKILQRDLGLAQSSGRRRGGKTIQTTTEGDTTKAEVSQEAVAASPKSKTAPATKAKEASQKSATVKTEIGPPLTPTNETTPSRDSPAPPTGPAASTPKGPKQSKAKQNVSSTATQAFLKHANPSQGVTETHLEAAFTPFGQVVKVEIDKKKGFGYVDFAEPEGLQKAIAASPIAIAQSQVVVLERKNLPSQQPKSKAGNEAPQQQQPQPPLQRGGKSGGRNGATGATGGVGGGSSGHRGRGGKGRSGGSKGNAAEKADKAPESKS